MTDNSVCLDSATSASLTDTLNGDHSEQFIRTMTALSLGQLLEDNQSESLAVARSLGFVDGSLVRLTDLGRLVADSMREYSFWRERDRRLHAESAYSYLERQSYSGKKVLEVGSGFGCNLLSLADVNGEFVGVEPVRVYRQLTEILALREGLPVPRVVEGQGESIPFNDEEFDVVLCYSSHQYMDVRKALIEMSRVLKRGGELQIIGGHLGAYARGSFGHLVSKPSLHGTKDLLVTIINTLAYSYLGKRLLYLGGAGATSEPIYPPRKCLYRWLTSAGLTVQLDRCRSVEYEWCYIARLY